MLAIKKVIGVIHVQHSDHFRKTKNILLKQ